MGHDCHLFENANALMRVLPAILLAFRDAALLERCSIEQAHVTHNHPQSDAATLCFARMLADLLAGPQIETHSHAVLRALIAAAKADGSLNAISQKWLKQPLPADL